jgi:NADH-quinone oxidoreductase subunit M
MGWIQHPLFLVTFFPLLGVIVIAFLKDEQRAAVRWTALLTSAATFGLAIWIVTVFNPNARGIQLELDQSWLQIAGIPIGFHLGIDGLGMMMVLLTTFLTPLALLSAWQSIEDRVRLFMIFFLLLEVGLTGVFLALDLVLFYVFWEFTLVPMYFLIGIWGGERRVYATIKFFLYTFAGSVLMLLGILYIGLQAGTFSLPGLIAARGSFASAQTWLFLVFALAFAIKVPMWPLHSWLPDAHTEAPTAGSVILAGVMLKMGAYGFLRFNLPLFPQASAQFAPWIAALAVIGILYGAIVAYAQTDVKRLVAYSSVSHLGFVMLGIFSLNPEGISGAILQMVNHGLSTGALFLVVGFLYDRRHTRQFSAYGGVWKIVPVMGVLALIVTLSSMGLPGLNGFVGEFTILLGAFGSTALGSPWFAAVAAVGVILAAVYLLFLFERVFLGPVTQEENRKLLDVNGREAFILAALLVMIFWIGLYPKPFFNLIQPAAENLAALAQATAVALH